MEGRVGDWTCILEEEGRGCYLVEVRRVGDTASTVRRRWRVDKWDMTQLGRVGRMVGLMRCIVNCDIQNYFSMEKYDAV
jgi:hypothetical protein